MTRSYPHPDAAAGAPGCLLPGLRPAFCAEWLCSHPRAIPILAHVGFLQKSKLWLVSANKTFSCHCLPTTGTGLAYLVAPGKHRGETDGLLGLIGYFGGSP